MTDLQRDLPVRAWQEERDLVAAVPRDDILGPGDPADRAGDPMEKEVSDAVAVSVIHGLEPVEVAEQDREPALMSARLCHPRGEGVPECPVIREPGQGVGGREFAGAAKLRLSEGEPRLLGEPVQEVELGA